ncbi:MAG: TonB-dependent receptor [Parvularculaceae bacterium]
MNRSLKQLSAVSIAALVAATPLAALAGVIEGRVSDQSQTVSLEGAIVRVQETGAATSTGRAGDFRFSGLPAGQYTLSVSYIGVDPTTITVTIPSDDATVRQDVRLGQEVAVVDNILVVGQRGALNSALSQQRASDKVITVLSADAVGQLPDENVAEAARRAVGVNIQNDQGEGRYVSIRGANPNFVTTTINGVRIPSPDADQRNVPLDVIDSDVLSSITITKSLTPDVDGDSIGGNVEISTLSGLDQKDLLLKLKAAGIYTDQVDKFSHRYSGVIADNFLDGRLGVAASVAYQKRKFGSENKETDGPDWVLDETVPYPEELELRDYQVTRERLTAGLNLDFQATDSLLLYAHGIYSDFSDEEIRSRIENKFGDPDYDSANSSGTQAVFDAAAGDEYEVDRDLKDRKEDQKIYSFVGGAKYTSDAITFDVLGSYSYAEESEPERLDSGFRAKFDEGLFGVDVSDAIQPKLYFPDASAEAAYHDASNYEFDGVERTNGLSKDDEVAFATNLRYDTELFGAPGYLKAGGKIRLRQKSYDLDLKIYDGFDGSDLLLSDFATSVDYSLDSINPTLSRDAFRDFFFANEASFELNDVDTAVESTGANYTADEDVYAAYAMAQRDFGPVSIVAGVRMEHTNYSASGFSVLTQEFEDSYAGDITATDPNTLIPTPAVAGSLLAEDLEFEYDAGDDETVLELTRIYSQEVSAKQNYTDWLPSVNMRWDVTDEVVARLGYYMTIVRPNLEAAAPRTLVEQGESDVEGEAGNPFLKRQKANNIDFSLEYYPSNKSIISVGVFYKDIKDLIANQQFENVVINGVAFDEVDSWVNLDDASLFGVEFNMQQPLDFLPSPLDGFIVSANYTYVDGETTLGDGREIALPGQSKHVATGILGYEKGPVDLRFAATYRGKYLDEINAGGDGVDRIVDDHLQLDVSAKYRVTDQFRLFAEFKNINNEPFVAYIQPAGFDRLNAQYEEYGWSAKFGVSFTY